MDELKYSVDFSLHKENKDLNDYDKSQQEDGITSNIHRPKIIERETTHSSICYSSFTAAGGRFFPLQTRGGLPVNSPQCGCW